MILHRQHQHLDSEPDEDVSVMSRRAILRRSLLGITGAGLASLLVACGGEEEDSEDDEAGDVQPPDAPDVDPDEPALPGTDDEADQDDQAEEDD
jgi:hypothetical protein